MWEMQALEYQKAGSQKAKQVRNWIKSERRIVEMLKNLPTTAC
jgi:hypothetical protein